MRSASVLAALLGSVIPALIGAVATVYAVSELARADARAVLVIWTVVGYLTLTDLGLTRSAATLVAGGTDARTAARALRPVSVTAGLVLSAGMLIFLQFSGSLREGVDGLAAAAVVPLPVLTTLTFPLLGAMEASGRFGLIALHKSLQSVVTYLIPPLLVAAEGLSSLGPAVLAILTYRLVAAFVLWWCLKTPAVVGPAPRRPRCGLVNS